MKSSIPCPSKVILRVLKPVFLLKRSKTRLSKMLERKATWKFFQIIFHLPNFELVMPVIFELKVYLSGVFDHGWSTSCCILQPTFLTNYSFQSLRSDRFIRFQCIEILGVPFKSRSHPMYWQPVEIKCKSGRRPAICFPWPSGSSR